MREEKRKYARRERYIKQPWRALGKEKIIARRL
jgi:hypothetical protein